MCFYQNNILFHSRSLLEAGNPEGAAGWCRARSRGGCGCFLAGCSGRGDANIEDPSPFHR